MEEVWKDLTLSTASPLLCGHHNHHHHYHHNHHRSSVIDNSNLDPSGSAGGVVLQDSLPLAFKETPDDVVHIPPPPPRPRPHPATALSLNSAMDLRETGGCCPVAEALRHNHHSCNNTSSNSNSSNSGGGPFISAAYADAMVGFPRQPAGIYTFCPPRNKRGLEQQMSEAGVLGGGRDGGDRRQKRMIKNRESAARSRARKQAYTHELEIEVQLLSRENEKLKKHNEELRLIMAAQLPTMKKLQRCKTFPF